jgi:glycosyltransferase involved in cell wall biosynthesis
MIPLVKNKLIRITTIPSSLNILLENQLNFMNQYYEVEAISSDEEGLKKVSDLQGVKVHCIEMTRKITPMLDIIALWKLYIYFKKEKPFIVHTHTPKAGTLGMIAAKLAGVPHRLHTVAGLPLMEAKGIKRLVLNFVEKITYYCATFIYPNSNGLKNIIIQEHFCQTEKLKVIGNGSSNGINTSYFNPELISDKQKQILRLNLGITKEDFVFIFVGRLVGDKGINELAHAFDKLGGISFGGHAKLLLVGAFETNLDCLKPNTFKLFDSNENIITVSYQNDVRSYFAISDCLVFPSYREGFPNVVMQAGAMGLPSIVTDINGCNEIIVEGENGTIIPVKNVVAIVEAMQKMCSDKVYYEQLQLNARPKIQSRYEQHAVCEALLAEYKSLLAQYNSTKG